jgi:hypothetical protein
MEATEAVAPHLSTAAARFRLLLDRLVETDFTAPLAFAALGIAFIASRLYWLDLGYGTDPDAWRVAITAQYLWDEASYWPSRLPGYPLHELVTALVVKGGWVWTNLTTVFVSLAGVYIFAALAKKLELPSRGALTLAFAFTPLLWINSVMTMDYMWALTFIMAAYLALLHRSPAAGGLLLGGAAGFRITSLYMLLPFWLLLLRTDRRSELRTVAFTSLATALVIFTPVLMQYGVGFLNFFDESVALDEFIKRLAKDGVGVIGAIAVIAAAALSLPRLQKLPGDLLRDPNVLVWVAVIVVYAFSYTRLPHEIAYLIPLFPFGFFLMSRYFSRTVLLWTLAAIVLAGFVDITSPEDASGIDRTTFTSARVGEGMLLSDIDTLRNQQDFAREVHRMTTTNPSIQHPAVVAVGFIYPEFVMLYKDELKIGLLEEDHDAISQLSDKGLAQDEDAEIDYVWLLDYDDMRAYQREGRTIYFTADAARSTYAVYGYRPAYFGAIELPLSRENPSLGEGTSSTDRR